MYGLSQDINLDFLKNILLTEVVIGSNELVLRFENSISIYITSRCKLTAINAGDVEIDKYAESATELCQLLNLRIEKVAWEEDGTLALTFDKAAVLVVYDDSSEYESYIIKNKNTEIVV
jgi:hypothetical protein